MCGEAFATVAHPRFTKITNGSLGISTVTAIMTITTQNRIISGTGYTVPASLYYNITICTVAIYLAYTSVLTRQCMTVVRMCDYNSLVPRLPAFLA